MDIYSGVKCPPQIAVGKYTRQGSVIADNGRHAKALLGHFQKPVPEADIGPNFRNLLTGVHDIGNTQQQLFPEAAAWVRHGKVFRCETT